MVLARYYKQEEIDKASQSPGLIENMDYGILGKWEIGSMMSRY